MIPIKQPHIEYLAKKILPQLGLELEDLDGFTCCPDPVWFRSIDNLAWTSVATRNLCVAEKRGLNILTLCNACAGVLTETNALMKKDAKMKTKVNEILKETGHEFQGSIEVRHVLDVLNKDIESEKIRSLVKRELKTLNVATHTGCHLIRPHEIMQFDNPEDPKVFDKLVSILGANPVNYTLKTQCCGFSMSLSYLDASSAATKDKLMSAREAGADCIVVGCPACFQQLDTGQLLASRAFKLNFKIPVLNYLQLLGLAMGYGLDEVGYNTHKIKDTNFEKNVLGQK